MPDSVSGPLFTPPPIFIRPGTKLILKDVYVFKCPLCGNQFRYDDPYEPMCTGPRWLDEHPPEVMRLIRTDTRRVLL